MELILQDIELVENTTNGNVFDVWYNDTTGTFIAQEVDGVRTFRYKLDGDFEEIVKEHGQEILEYRLGTVTADDVVTVGDVFMHGKFIEILL
jgi:hypothetical protein